MTSEDGPTPADSPPTRRLPLHILVPTVVALAVLGLMAWSAGSVLAPRTPVRVQPVVFDRSATALQPQDDRPAPRRGVTVQAPGWLEADPYSIACTALTDGVIEAVLALEGDRVKEGQVVARMVSTDAGLLLAEARADLALAKADRDSVQADVDAARLTWENPIDRDRALGVSRGMLAETNAELAQLPSLIDAETATLEQLREELTRSREAFASGGANEIEVILADKRENAQEATVRALRQREAILMGRRETLRAELEAAERHARLRIAEQRALAGATAMLARAEAAVQQAEVQERIAALRVERMQIRAPINGIVQRRLKKPGDKVMLGMDDPASAQIVHLYDPEKLQVRVDVPLADASNIFKGQACEVTVEILPDRTFKGEVTRITHEADVQKNTLQVKVRVVDPDPLLRPEMLTRVKFLPTTFDPAAGAGRDAPSPAPTRPSAGVYVPQNAITEDAGTKRVWVIRDRRGEFGRAAAVPVITGAERDGWIRVEADLHPGDLLAIDPPALRPGGRVRVLPHEAEVGS